MLLTLTVLPGDGIGPEVTEQAVLVLQTVAEGFGHTLQLKTKLIGGAALAACVVALPLMAKGAETAFARVDRRLEEIARCHGLSPLATFRAVTLPLALPALGVALMVTALRAFGEFGATLVFAGYLPGETNTAPLEIYVALQSGDDSRARALVAALVLVAILSATLLARWGRRPHA